MAAVIQKAMALFQRLRRGRPAPQSSGPWWYRQYYDCTEEGVLMDARMELAALDQRTLREPQLLVGETIRAVGWADPACEVVLELMDGRRAVITAALRDGVPVLVLGEGVEATLLRGLVQQQRP